MARGRQGFLAGIAAYGMWGAFPLYWPLLEPAGAVELLAHRIAWTAVVMVVLVVAFRLRSAFVALLREPRTRWLLVLASAVISVNWGTFIWGVNNEHVVETSLGYFINPLVTVLAGVVVLGERLRPLQWTAMGLAALAVAGLTWDYGRPPWVALTLAFSFAAYGLVRKKADVGAVEGLAVETAVVTPVAVGYLVWLQLAGQSHAFEDPPWHFLLLATSGAVTALPLICFGAAATRVSLTALGLMQYLAPTLQFVLGVALLGEPMPTARLVGFTIIWASLMLFTVDSMRERQRLRLQRLALGSPTP
ncbi:EamA family transporter RarD [Nocardioides caldifontis]|uniref:EamA family transporter RarD n=1 Tax=Nocardioides caldifontis TaxID=2588938 RepID=UPI0011DF3B00|nr:EamA family transporter RarD [Nocardioides caldifontis]